MFKTTPPTRPAHDRSAGAETTMSGEDAKRSLVVVSHRLPVERCSGRSVLSPGLASSLIPILRDRGGAWVGSTSAEQCKQFELDGVRLIPLDLDTEEHFAFYDGFSKTTLWPLYHDVIVRPEFHSAWWNAYRSVNAHFAQAAVDSAALGATVWVHDYHLQLVPEMIRAQRPDVRIGFYSHLPFPPRELFAQLPWRADIVRGLLGANVIGFQQDSDLNNFRSAALHFSDVEPGEIDKVLGTFPMSIDACTIRDLAAAATTQLEARQMRMSFGNPEKLLVGIDQLDPAKGIVHRLRAYEELLNEGAIDPKTTALVQIAVPSREGHSSNDELRAEVEQLVGRINGRFSSLGRAAIYYCHRSYSLEQMVSMYLAADTLLATSLRDGMNLVAKEFVAARHGRGGSLVLSEFAGAAAELHQSLLVNPYDIDELKLAVCRAVAITDDEARRRINSMAEIVTDHDARWWVRTFLEALEPADLAANHDMSRPISPGAQQGPPACGPRSSLLPRKRHVHIAR